MESLVRWREPAAFVALGLVLGNLVLMVLAVLVEDGPVVDVAARLSYPAALAALVVLLAMLVLSCVLGRSPHARLLTALSLVSTMLAAAVAVALAVADLAVGGPSVLVELLPGVAALSVSVVAVGLLVMLLRRCASAARAERPVVATAEPEPAEPEVVDPQQQPTWPTDQAAGAAWRTAGDAAVGAAPATAWAVPAEAEGWGPPPESAVPDSAADEDLRPPAADGWPPRRN